MTRIVAFCRNAWRTGNCNCRKSLVLTAFRCYGISLSLFFAIFEAWTDHLVNSSNTSRILVPTINAKISRTFISLSSKSEYTELPVKLN